MTINHTAAFHPQLFKIDAPSLKFQMRSSHETLCHATN